MKKALIIGIVFFLCFVSTYSQNSSILQNQKVQPVMLEPTLVISDLVGVYQKLETVEIRGNEVETFLQIKKKLKDLIETAQKKEMKATDNIKMDIELPMAQNLLNLMDRAVLQGAEAEGFQRFRQAIVDSAKKLQNK